MIKEREENLINEFEMFNDWMEKYEYIIDLGKDLPLIDPDKKTKENIITGCQSRVWLDAKYENDKIYFYADSDAIITKGIISLLIRVLSDASPKEIIEADLYFIDAIGLKEHLSPTRSNGLLSMVKQMKHYALAYTLRH